MLEPCLFPSKGHRKCCWWRLLMSKYKMFWAQTLHALLVDRVNIYTGVWVNPFSPDFFSPPPLSLFSSSLFWAVCISSSNPHYTGSACFSILSPVVCYSYWSAFLLLQRKCEQRDKDSESTCFHQGGGRGEKNLDERAKGWLIRKLAVGALAAGMS